MLKFDSTKNNISKGKNVPWGTIVVCNGRTNIEAVKVWSLLLKALTQTYQRKDATASIS